MRGNFIKDSGPAVVFHNIVVEQCLLTIDVTPDAGTDIVVHTVVPEDYLAAFGQLDSAGFPAKLEPTCIVRPHLAAVYNDADADAGDPDLAIVVDAATLYVRPVPYGDCCGAVKAYLAIPDSPADTRRRLDLYCAGLSWACIFLDNQIADQYVWCRRHECRR